jgi:ribosomal protein L11 methyltransferase
MGVRRIAEEDWANAWKAFFPVLHVGDRTVVVPPWRRYRRPTGGTGADEIIVRLDPGLAFGTGTHPTTRLCLQAVEALITSGQRVLDVGTGSGILAIAAARLGADVVALDVDPLAVTAARANVRRNRVARRVRVSEGSPDALFSTAEGEPSTKSAASFDVILANITARVNAALAPFLAPRLAPAGRLVASGILAESAELVVAAYAQLGLEVAARAQEGDWVALTLARPAPSGR